MNMGFCFLFVQWRLGRLILVNHYTAKAVGRDKKVWDRWASLAYVSLTYHYENY